MATTETQTPAKTPAKRTPAPSKVPTYDTSDGATVDSSALHTASQAVAAALKAGAAAFVRAGAFSHTVASQIVAARLSITLQSGMPDFGGKSLAYAELKEKVIDPFYAGLDQPVRGQLQSRVSTALTEHLDRAISDWTLANRSGLPAKADVSMSGDAKKAEGPDRPPRLVVDPTPALKKAVLDVYAASKLEPAVGRWGKEKAAFVPKEQPKLDSPVLNVSEAAAKVRDGGVAAAASAGSVHELATALYTALLAAKNIGAEDRKAGEASSLAASDVLKACGKIFAGKWEGEADAAKIAASLWVAPTQ